MTTRKNNKRIILYTKHCLHCQYPKEWQAILDWYQHEGIEIKVRRTAYRPDWHFLASKLYKSSDYTAFLVVGKGKVIDFMIEAKNCKNKLAELGKTKEGGDDLCDVQRASGRNRKSRVVAESTKTTLEDEDKEE